MPERTAVGGQAGQDSQRPLQEGVDTPSIAGVQRVLEEHQETAAARAAAALLGSLIQSSQYVGEVYSLGYDSALVNIHDRHRQQVGGIPSLSFLLATRLSPRSAIEFRREDSSVLLLRVMDAAPLPNQAETDRIRVETAQRVSGDEQLFWDSPEVMDFTTANVLSFAGVRCRIIGTFFLDEDATPGAALPLRLRFGSDISNYYPNRGLKVYRPNGDALERIVNFRDAADTGGIVEVGKVRYASTNRAFQDVVNVPVRIAPYDLLRQKTALFGMTRIGKSNTTKIILKAVFDLRFDQIPLRVGQLVFDPNGEYANENVQDRGCIKNVWRRADGRGVAADVVTYGSLVHPLDPDRRLMLVNFFETANLQIGKEIIDSVLADRGTIYTSNFRQVGFSDVPAPADRSAVIRYNRRVLAYRALLAKASFDIPPSLQPQTAGLFSRDLLQAMQASPSANANEYQAAAVTLGSPSPTWGQLAVALQHLDAFIEERSSGYAAFNTQYMARPNGSGDAWADEDLKKVLRMFGYANGARLIGEARPMHSGTVSRDYAAEIYDALVAGALVIVDQSGGDEAVNRASASRVMREVFARNQLAFRNATQPPDILVYLEEAHNILPSSGDADLLDIWVRTAKEGAKYCLGLVYATQEVSSIQKNILKNTSNWFIGHLNNTDETKELVKYYDFEDFEASIRRAQDKGFLRIKTLSNLFVVPTQINLFEAPTA
jgi:hypothetical protein